MSEIRQRASELIEKGYDKAQIENYFLDLDNYGQFPHSKVILRGSKGEKFELKASSHLSDRESWYKFCKEIRYGRKKAIVNEDGVIENWNEFENKIKGEDPLWSQILIVGCSAAAAAGMAYLWFSMI